MKETEYIYLTPLPIRIWHWLNAFGFIVLALTGLQIRFPEYVEIFGDYKNAIRLHNAAGFVVSASYLLWFGYYLFIARTLTKLYIPTLEDIRSGIFRQALYYFFNYFMGRPNPHVSTPEDKFNPLQKTVYLVIMIILLPLVILSGFLLMYVTPLRGIIHLVGGIKTLVSIHFLLACGFCSFLFVHIYLATLGHTPFAHFKSMWHGWEERKKEHEGNEHEEQP
jgi:thiosulfate reductase cytochrome b subunit